MFARLLDEAQEGMYRKVLGRQAGNIVARAFTKPGNELSYQYVIFAEQGGRIVGMASGSISTTCSSIFASLAGCFFLDFLFAMANPIFPSVRRQVYDKAHHFVHEFGGREIRGHVARLRAELDYIKPQ